MLAYTYVQQGRFALLDKPKPTLLHPRDAIVRVTLASICTSDLHIKHGFVPRAVPGITVGHEMVGIVEEIGSEVTAIGPGDRVAVNVETFCGDCFFCRHGWVNNCTDPNGGWALGCRIDGGQAEFVRVPYADQGLSKIPEGVSDLQALLVGDLLATGYWAAEISEICTGDSVLIIGAGPPAYAPCNVCGSSIPAGSSSATLILSASILSGPITPRSSPLRQSRSSRPSWRTAPTAEPTWCWRSPAARRPFAWPGIVPAPTPS